MVQANRGLLTVLKDGVQGADSMDGDGVLDGSKMQGQMVMCSVVMCCVWKE